VLGVNWAHLDFGADGVARGFVQRCVDPVRRLAGITIDRKSILEGLFGPGSVSDHVRKAYQEYLFGALTLQDLPDDDQGPRFVINATNVQSAVLCRFSKPYIWDYRVGRVDKPRRLIAEAVAASSAFPPVLSPAVLKFEPGEFVPGSGKDLERPPFTTTMVLTDGGVYDNLGLETVWKSCKTILVSDGGGRLQPEEEPSHLWGRHALRILDMIDRQVRSLRYRELISAYKSKTVGGTYWGTYTNIADYGVPTPLNCPVEKTTELAHVPTRLAAMPAETQERLINWGYAVCDAAMRAHVDPTIAPATVFPYPAHPVA